jgi:hypothetical protein
MKAPSKDWKEDVAADEEKRFNEYAEKIVEIQKKKSAIFGNGRALHRKMICGLQAKLQVLEKLPEYASQGCLQSQCS